MKSTLIRTLAILILGTSMSAFAATSNPCSGKEAGKTSSNQDQAATKNAKKEKKAHDKKNKDQKDQNDKSDQEKEFDRVLQGIWG